MTEIQIAKVREALRLFEESGAIRDAIKATNLKGLNFYRVLRAKPELGFEYVEIQQMRAEFALDEAFALLRDPTVGGTEKVDPQLLRVMIQERIRLSEKYHPQKFGDRLHLEVTQKPSLAAAFENKFRAIMQPRHHLSSLSDATDVEFTSITDQRTTDSASVASPETADDVYRRVFGDEP